MGLLYPRCARGHNKTRLASRCTPSVALPACSGRCPETPQQKALVPTSLPTDFSLLIFYGEPQPSAG